MAETVSHMANGTEADPPVLNTVDIFTLPLLYRKYWKNAEKAVELPGLSSWSIFL